MSSLLSLLFLFVSATTASKWTLPEERGFITTTRTQFIGPQANEEVERELRVEDFVIFDGNICGGISEQFPNKTVLFRHGVGCSDEKAYLRFYSTGARAIISSRESFTPPGHAVFSHDGRRGSRTKHLPMIWLQIEPQDMDDLMDQVNAQEQIEVSLSLDPNEWKELFESVYWILFMRVLSTLANLYVAGRGLHILWLRKRHGVAQKSILTAVLVVDTTSVITLTVVNGLGSFASADTVPFPMSAFFAFNIAGLGFLTTAWLGLFWRNQFNAYVTLTKSEDPFVTHPKIVVLSAVVLFGIDTAAGSAFATHAEVTFMSFIASITYFLSNLITGVYFLYNSQKILVEMRKGQAPTAATDFTRRTDSSKAMLLMWMTLWLRRSAFFMLITALYLIFLAARVVFTIQGNFFCLTLFNFGRTGTAWCHVMALLPITKVDPGRRFSTIAKSYFEDIRRVSNMLSTPPKQNQQLQELPGKPTMIGSEPHNSHEEQALESDDNKNSDDTTKIESEKSNKITEVGGSSLPAHLNPSRSDEPFLA